LGYIESVDLGSEDEGGLDEDGAWDTRLGGGTRGSQKDGVVGEWWDPRRRVDEWRENFESDGSLWEYEDVLPEDPDVSQKMIAEHLDDGD